MSDKIVKFLIDFADNEYYGRGNEALKRAAEVIKADKIDLYYKENEHFMRTIKLKYNCAFEKASFAAMIKVAENYRQPNDDLFNFFWRIGNIFQLESYLDEVNNQGGNRSSNLILIQEIEIDGYKVAQFKDYFGSLWWTASYEYENS